MVTVASGATTFQADMMPLEFTRATRAILHEVLGRQDPDVVFRPASSRSGVLVLVLPTLAAAVACANAHATSQVWTLTNPVHPEANMSYVATDDMTVTVDPVGRVKGHLSIPFRQVNS